MSGGAERQLEELRTQAAILTHLEHRALVKVREVFVGQAPDGEGDRLYFVMKWIEGRSMQDALERGELRSRRRPAPVNHCL
ncbi:hypothetical protein [Micromonospora sp. NPDC126480]|uniref:hypothetical protein n=1 Tax=Micromonospora sp. NPDC126480 TaxID=3155312 RepID=UPI0033326346